MAGNPIRGWVGLRDMQIQLLQLAMLAKELVENYEARGYATVSVEDMDLWWFSRLSGRSFTTSPRSLQAR